jgi:hypothetical protein
MAASATSASADTFRPSDGEANLLTVASPLPPAQSRALTLAERRLAQRASAAIRLIHRGKAQTRDERLLLLAAVVWPEDERLAA